MALAAVPESTDFDATAQSTQWSDLRDVIDDLDEIIAAMDEIADTI